MNRKLNDKELQKELIDLVLDLAKWNEPYSSTNLKFRAGNLKNQLRNRITF